ncbi:MAG: septum site-determining protein MinC [Aquificaceae bacterium]|nr:septum site-determining protein MinC [Aquificaceae bacterium]
MIEVKGITIPVVLIEIKEKRDVDYLMEEIKVKLSSKLFEESYVLIDSRGLLSKEELEKLEKAITEVNTKTIKRLTSEATGKTGKQRLLVVQKHLRSGQRIEHNGDILILGDVNRDAQVIATGNIIVMGKLKGIAIAGALGDERAVIVALEMEPQQIRIGKRVAIMEDTDRKSPGYPEVAKIEGSNIVLESFTEDFSATRPFMSKNL